MAWKRKPAPLSYRAKILLAMIVEATEAKSCWIYKPQINASARMDGDCLETRFGDAQVLQSLERRRLISKVAGHPWGLKFAYSSTADGEAEYDRMSQEVQSTGGLE